MKSSDYHKLNYVIFVYLNEKAKHIARYGQKVMGLT